MTTALAADARRKTFMPAPRRKAAGGGAAGAFPASVTAEFAAPAFPPCRSGPILARSNIASPEAGT